MSKKIFYKEYLSNDKNLKKPIYLQPGDTQNLKAIDRQVSEIAKFPEIKR